jgi:hypothetical protein
MISPPEQPRPEIEQGQPPPAPEQPLQPAAMPPAEPISAASPTVGWLAASLRFEPNGRYFIPALKCPALTMVFIIGGSLIACVYGLFVVYMDFRGGKMVSNIEGERNRIWEILACPGARMNPKLAECLAYDSNVTASVAIGVLAHTLETVAGTPRRNPVAWK